ncbi:helix-turn-helix transcriptional regulator [Pseudomonas sp. zfem003]|uniref:helix-turn-helix domain-containing protein n=1 Tax=Pseudomonas sp. zfem003 TaxID=3078198 RepID=UPI0029286900|nr:helix-turn-helix transcriptional regulator [Pseudomonas sp. zfem003]MDU9400813.1 helix-turn-helix transcriptional regulator [Pseudomonas sp. zfem003]
MSENSQERAMTIGTNLKKLREARKLTQRFVWEAAGVSKSSYTAYEAGRSDPTGEIIVRLARVLGVSTDELLLNEHERTLSEDLAPILRRFDALPVDIRNQARIALKGVLFGYEQEALR